MSRPIKTTLLAAIIVGGLWALVNRDQIENPQQFFAQLSDRFSESWPADFSQTLSQAFSENWSAGFDQISQLSDRFFQASTTASETSVAAGTDVPVIRIASFALNLQTEATTDLTPQIQLLTEICQRYDVIALQGVPRSQLPSLERVAELAGGQRQQADYYFITDQTTASESLTVNVILFNRNTVALDHLTWYSVNDPDRLLRRPPLVGWFRTQLADPNRAFTFTLVSAEFNSGSPEREVDYLRELYRVIREDGRQEDDVILVGDFNSCNRAHPTAVRQSGLTWVVENRPTDVRQQTLASNMIFNTMATVEFTGQGGVLDFMRLYNLRLTEAEQVSTQLPVWAEFSAQEGGFTPEIWNNAKSIPDSVRLGSK